MHVTVALEDLSNLIKFGPLIQFFFLSNLFCTLQIVRQAMGHRYMNGLGI